uniref:NET domain-containing protein n=1 Tax=Rhabditophanes sp. KR3021 TaxID=114890 RepID=A0AC35TZK3_9BILA
MTEHETFKAPPSNHHIYPIHPPNLDNKQDDVIEALDVIVAFFRHKVDNLRAKLPRINVNNIPHNIAAIFRNQTFRDLFSFVVRILKTKSNLYIKPLDISNEETDGDEYINSETTIARRTYNGESLNDMMNIITINQFCTNDGSLHKYDVHKLSFSTQIISKEDLLVKKKVEKYLQNNKLESVTDFDDDCSLASEETENQSVVSNMVAAEKMKKMEDEINRLRQQMQEMMSGMARHNQNKKGRKSSDNRASSSLDDGISITSHISPILSPRTSINLTSIPPPPPLPLTFKLSNKNECGSKSFSFGKENKLAKGKKVPSKSSNTTRMDNGSLLNELKQVKLKHIETLTPQEKKASRVEDSFLGNALREKFKNVHAAPESEEEIEVSDWSDDNDSNLFD